MIKKSLGAAVAALLGFVPLSGAQANLITWAYSGSVLASGLSGSIFSVGQTVTGTFVFDDATLGSDLGRPLLGDAPARRHQAEVDLGEVECRQVLAFERGVAERDLHAVGPA